MGYGNAGLCDFDHCKQCTDTNACNYDADLKPYKFTGPSSKGSWSADSLPWKLIPSVGDDHCKTVDQCGDCVYKKDENKNCDGCKDEEYDNYDANAIVHNDSLCKLRGCYPRIYEGSEPLGVLNGLTIDNLDSNVTDHDDSMCELLGCTDPEACNYNSYANKDDGSCQITEITDLKVGVEGNKYSWNDTVNVTFK